MALPTAQDAEEDVFGSDRGLPERFGLFARELDAAACFAGDENLRCPADRVEGVVGKVAMPAVCGLLADTEGAGDLAPGRSGLKGAADELWLELVELEAQGAQGSQRRLRI
jgi:hypothetical protein